MTKIKPNFKAYGSIGHMIGSRLGAGDHHIPAGQQSIFESGKPNHRIIVQEKLDGSCTAVYYDPNDGPVAVLRKGHRAIDSPYFMHHIFHDCVYGNRDAFASILRPEERLVGEWLAQAHGVKYRLHPEVVPWYVFDLIRKDGSRALYQELIETLGSVGMGGMVPRVVHNKVAGLPLTSARALIPELERTGTAIDPMEGFVYRAEHKGKVIAVAKYVRSSHQPGIYLPEISGADAVWNWSLAGKLWAKKQEAEQEVEQELAQRIKELESNAQSEKVNTSDRD